MELTEEEIKAKMELFRARSTRKDSDTFDWFRGEIHGLKINYESTTQQMLNDIKKRRVIIKPKGYINGMTNFKSVMPVVFNDGDGFQFSVKSEYAQEYLLPAPFSCPPLGSVKVGVPDYLFNKITTNAVELRPNADFKFMDDHFLWPQSYITRIHTMSSMRDTSYGLAEITSGCVNNKGKMRCDKVIF
ncbi:uncharacterized protein LOC119661805 [Teleopsis dalmanni]|uniref:uncharacterized protein LOC119661805 n=1 Tax=Teleopsis dalmanni TaxID=139649 RepID=UPI0018CCC595|nr:uncharacterized protein LOC119661805 [Teleopsis dalmanni]